MINRHLAQREQKTLGEVISALARQGLARGNARSPAVRHGIPLLPTGKGAVPVTPELVNQLRDELP